MLFPSLKETEQMTIWGSRIVSRCECQVRVINDSKLIYLFQNDFYGPFVNSNVFQNVNGVSRKGKNN